MVPTDAAIPMRRTSTGESKSLMAAGSSVNQDGAKIVDVGVRRPRDEGVTERAEKTMTVIVRERLGRTQSLRPGALERIGRDRCTGDLLEAIDPIGVSRERMNARLPVERDC